MKKIFLSLVALSIFSMSVWASPLSREVAREMAVSFWTTYNPGGAALAADLKEVKFPELQYMYVFANATGFVIVAADDCVRPVLGYSFDSQFPTTLHAEIRYWLEGYESQIAAAVAYAAKQSGNTPLMTPAKLAIDTAAVPVMCNTRWDQSGRYNSFCPYDSVENARTVVGCVATAMAQLMKFWNHPSCGVGSSSYLSDYGTLSADYSQTTYLWNYMPNIVSDLTPSAKADAVALLSYHCGISVEMNYGMSSGAYVTNYGGRYGTMPCSERAFRDYFKYSPDLHGEERGNYNDSVWKTMIYTELYSGRPLLYSGSDRGGGHAFVLDGCDTMSYFHFNWGWGGYADGYFTINNMAPIGGGTGTNATNTFNYGQQAVFGVEPVPETFDTVSTTRAACSAMGELQFYEYSLPIADSSYQLIHLNTVYNLTVTTEDSYNLYLHPNGGEGSMFYLNYCPSYGVELPECTFTRPGYTFVGWCRYMTGTGSGIYAPGETLMLSSDRTYYAIWKDTSNVGIPEAASLDVKVWPNPVTDVFHITCTNAADADATMVDAIGRKVWQGKVVSGGVEIDLGNYPAGVYLLKVSSQDGVYKQRIIKQ